MSRSFPWLSLYWHPLSALGRFHNATPVMSVLHVLSWGERSFKSSRPPNQYVPSAGQSSNAKADAGVRGGWVLT